METTADIINYSANKFNIINVRFHCKVTAGTGIPGAQHYESILDFFDNRSTNASAESFNTKIKAFRVTSRGVRDTTFLPF